MELKFRQANSDDAAVVSGVLLKAAQWLDAKGMALWQPRELTVERILPDLADGYFHIAEIGGETAGVLRFTLSDPFFWPDLPEGGSAFIHRLAVRRKFAGQGIARAMIAFAKDRAASLGGKHLRLDCASDRERLRAFYEGLGFQHHSDFQAGPWHVSRYMLEVGHDLD
jgi:ribosomal protein S18 acetylase RimI-like enzyme